MVATARITIRFLLLFQTAKIERNETVARKMWGLNFPYAVIIEIRVKI